MFLGEPPGQIEKFQAAKRNDNAAQKYAWSVVGNAIAKSGDGRFVSRPSLVVSSNLTSCTTPVS